MPDTDSRPPSSPAGAQPLRGVLDNMRRVIRGKDESIELTLIALLSGGHALIEDVPGLGKTMLARALAQSFALDFRRVQGTPDLLPSDVTGSSVFDPRTQDFTFHRGPVFTQILLVDEINRATPRTQSALLEAMEEHQVTVDGESHPLPEPFFLIATQNPIELAGTFPLPEAQLDRFLLKFALGYPADEVEVELLTALERRHPIEDLAPCADATELSRHREAVHEVFVHPAITRYVQRILRATRDAPAVRHGVSPRGGLGLIRAAKSRAYLHGEDYVTPDDIQALAVPVLAHRMVLDTKSRFRESLTDESVVRELVDAIEAPIDYQGSR